MKNTRDFDFPLEDTKLPKPLCQTSLLHMFGSRKRAAAQLTSVNHNRRIKPGCLASSVAKERSDSGEVSDEDLHDLAAGTGFLRSWFSASDPTQATRIAAVENAYVGQ